MKQVLLKRVVWGLLVVGALTPIAAFAIGQLNAQPNAVLFAGDSDGDSGGG